MPAPDSPYDPIARGDGHARQGRFDLAMPDYLAALSYPTRVDAAASRIAAIAMLQDGHGRPQAAIATFDTLLAHAPDAQDARFRRGMLKLQLGDFAAGWADYEARWASPQFLAGSRGGVPAALVPELAANLSPADLTGRRVLMIGEQGIGDEVMFAGLIPDLMEIAASVTLVCEPRLVRLFAQSFPQVAVFAPQDAQIDQDTIDVVAPLGGLAHAVRRSADAFPGTPYLEPTPDAAARWAERLGPKAGRLRIGLAWRGGTPATRGELRSVTLSQLRPLLDLPDCEFVSLQYDAAGAELASAGLRAFPAADLRDFDEMAGLMASLDAVVSVQSATVHLAGALGRPCLALVQALPEWRYMRQGEAMPWYRSVTLLRQHVAGDWSGVIAEAAARLRLRAKTGR